MLSRRILGVGLAALVASGRPATAQRLRVEVWRDPSCGCCSGWVEHLRGEGFVVEDRVVPSVAPFRRLLGTPADLLSCHAARVASIAPEARRGIAPEARRGIAPEARGGLALEGHVPALAIRRLLAERPGGVVGLAVPAMPVGSPGMEVPGRKPDTYDVIAWSADGTQRPFMRFAGTRPA